MPAYTTSSRHRLAVISSGQLFALYLPIVNFKELIPCNIP